MYRYIYIYIYEEAYSSSCLHLSASSRHLPWGQRPVINAVPPAAQARAHRGPADLGVLIPVVPAVQRQVIQDALGERHHHLHIGTLSVRSIALVPRKEKKKKKKKERAQNTWSRTVIHATFHHVSAFAMLCR